MKQSDYQNKGHRALNRVKKAGRIVLIIVLCIAVILFVTLGIVIYKGLHQETMYHLTMERSMSLHQQLLVTKAKISI